MNADNGHIAELKIARQAKKILWQHAFLKTPQVGLIRIQGGNNRLPCHDLGAILQAKPSASAILHDELAHGGAGQDRAAIRFHIAPQGLRQHPAASFGDGLPVVVNAGDHHIEARGRAGLIRQDLRGHGPAQDKRAHMVVLEILQGELARAQLVVAQTAQALGVVFQGLIQVAGGSRGRKHALYHPLADLAKLLVDLPVAAGVGGRVFRNGGAGLVHILIDDDPRSRALVGMAGDVVFRP